MRKLFSLSYIWFSENLRENTKEKKMKEKVKKIENTFKFNKLFLYISLNLFYLFLSIITRLNNFKIY